MKKSPIIFVAASALLLSLSGCNDSKGPFVIKWNNYDGTTIELDGNVAKGETPKYDSKTPYRVNDESNYYVFDGWDKEVVPASKDTVYTATYKSYSLDAVTPSPDGYVDVMPTNNGEGNIFHAFCWTFKDIKDKLPDLVNAGFKSVQTMPIQTPKGGGAEWWAFYQPLSFSIASESKLGTRQDFLDLCEEADKLGVAIIVDVVFNHLANINDDQLEEDGTPKVFPGVADYEPEIYAHRNDADNPTFHHNPKAEGSGAITQYYQWGKLPDLNTANKTVQARALSFLLECIDAGADGFRFDAAKHIETPDDPQYASDFWPSTLGVAKEYYKTKTGKDLFAYGEILDGPDGGRDISYYTKHMAVTDNAYGSIVRNALNGNADSAATDYIKKTDAENLVTWVESHDTYTESGSHQNDEKILMGFAVTGTRAKSRSLYLSRPNDALTVGTIGNYEYENNTLGAINRFHNRFYNATEYVSSDATLYVKQAINPNGDAGAVIVDLNRTKNSYVHLDKLGTGVYYDQTTGEQYVVRNGHLTFEMPMSGIVILTKSNNPARPTLTIDNRGGLFLDKLSVTLRAGNGTGKYSINGGEEQTFEGKYTIEGLESKINKDNIVNLTVTVENDKFSLTRHYVYQKVSVIEGYFNVLNINPTYFTDYEIYMWSWSNKSGGKWSKEYTVQDGILLIDISEYNAASKDDKATYGYKLACFEKGHVITDTTTWGDDSLVLKKTSDMTDSILAQGYFDASNF